MDDSTHRPCREKRDRGKNKDDRQEGIPQNSALDQIEVPTVTTKRDVNGDLCRDKTHAEGNTCTRQNREKEAKQGTHERSTVGVRGGGNVKDKNNRDKIRYGGHVKAKT